MRLGGLFNVAAVVCVGFLFAPTLHAVPVTYSYKGTPFTETHQVDMTTHNVGPSWLFVTGQDYMYATVVLDIEVGTPTSLQVSCHYPFNPASCSTPIMLGVTSTGPFGFGKIEYDSQKPRQFSILYLSGSFSIDANGEMTYGSIFVDEISGFFTRGSLGNGDGFSIEHAHFIDSGGTSVQGVWSKQSVPEPASVLSLVFGTIAAVLFARSVKVKP